MICRFCNSPCDGSLFNARMRDYSKRGKRTNSILFSREFPRGPGGAEVCHEHQRAIVRAGGVAEYLIKLIHRETLVARIEQHANHKLSLKDIGEIERLAREELLSQRAIAERLGVSTNTVKRYFPADAKCDCGLLLIEHRGWCTRRYALSGRRQAVIKRQLRIDPSKPKELTSTTNKPQV